MKLYLSKVSFLNVFNSFKNSVKGYFSNRKVKHLTRDLFFITIISFTIVYFYKVSGATFIFNQSSWTGGVDISSVAVHGSNQTNWNKYYSQTGLSVGSTLMLASTAYAFTDDGATSTTPQTPTSGGGFANGTLSLASITGSGSGASVGIVPTLNAVSNWDTVLKAIPSAVVNGFTIHNGGDDVYIAPGGGTAFYKYSISSNSWTTLSSAPGAIGNYSRAVYSSSDNVIYATQGSGVGFYKYNIATGVWSTLTNIPGATGNGSQMIRNGSDNDIYLTRGGSTGSFYRYSISGGTWSSLATVWTDWGSSMIRNGSDNDIYITKGAAEDVFYRYSISTGLVTTLAAAPDFISTGSMMIRNGSDDDIYVTKGHSDYKFFKYSISSGLWTTLATIPGSVSPGNFMIRYGSSNDIYIARGGASTGFYKYSISGNTWSTPTATPSAVGNSGDYMFYNNDGSQLYLIHGGSSSSFSRYSISGGTWAGSNTSNITSAPATLGEGSQTIRNASSDDIYVTRGGASTGFYKYSISGNSWTTLTSVPDTIGNSSSMIRNGSDDDIYVSRGGASTEFYKYSISGNSWTTLTSIPNSVSFASKMIRNGSDNDIYITRGGNSANFYKYSISGNSWTTLTDVPTGISSGSSVTRNASDNDIYVMAGNGTSFYKYSISGNSWTTLTSAPGGLNDGASMIRNGSDNDIYVTRGGMNTGFYKYSISGNSWTTLTSLPNAIWYDSRMIRNGSDNDIYVSGGRFYNTFYKYSISGNSWTTLASTLGTMGYGSSMIRNGSDNEIYITQGENTGFYKYIINTTTYDPSGTFASAPINLSNGANFSTLSFSTTLNSQTVTLKARSSATIDFSSAPAWGICSTISSGNSLSTGGCVTDGHQYIQYQATLSTGNSLVTPTLDSVTINYNQYATGTLVSSVYDTSSSENLISKLTWTESATSSNETIKFQVRSSLDGNTWSNWCGSSITCDGSDYFISSDNGVILNSSHPLRNSSNDKYLQYRTFLSSGGSITPELSNVSVQYVVNASPEFDNSYGGSGVMSLQSTSTDETLGLVQISYKVRDTDTTTGNVTQGFVTPSFEYNIGAGWVAIPVQYLSANATDNKAVEEGSYTTYNLTWNAQAQIPDVYTATARVRVIVNDNEAANNISIATSSDFVLDTTAPAVAFHINGTAGSVILNATDTSLILDYSVSNSSDMSSPVTGAGSGSVLSYDNPWTFSNSSTSVTVYSVVRDIYGNTATTTVIAPIAPTSFDVRDVSRPSFASYQEFLLWPVYPSIPDGAVFSKYEIYKSTNGTDYSHLVTITNPSINYYIDALLASSTNYFYKIKYVDSDGDTSDYSMVVSDIADGQGGTDSTPPTISAVTISDIKNTSAKVTWTTDELANSRVDYGLSSAYGSQTSDQSYVTPHTVYLNNLTPNTEYFIKINSTDVATNIGSNDNNGSSFTFTTIGGPVISNVTTSDLSDNSATVFWNTNTPTDGYVLYGTDSTLTTYAEAGSATIETSSTTPYQHKVIITGLTTQTRYYFKVRSTDESDNITIDNNNSQNYDFVTTYDTKPPVISEVANPLKTSNSAVITWTTDELSTSQTEYGTIASTTDGSYTHLTQHVTNPTIYHSMTLSPETFSTSGNTNELVKLTTYYYRVKSTDKAGNVAVSDEGTFTTTDTGQVIINNYSSSGGGSYTAPVKLDEKPPVISEIKVENITPFGATVTFITDEDARGLVQFGVTDKYGQNNGEVALGTKHSIALKGLSMGTTYNFSVNAIDKSGNVSFSGNETFKTTFMSQDLGMLTKLENNVDSIQQKIEDIIESALPSINPPFISKPEVDSVGQDFASIIWKTNIKAYGSVNYSSDEDYVKDNKYISEAGDSNNKKTEHRIDLNNLKPNTKYHISVNSYVFPEARAKTDDITFVTKAGDIQAQIMDKKKDSFRVVWTTSEPTTSIVEYKKSGSNKADRKTDSAFTNNHDVKIDKIVPATTYTVRAYGLTKDGNTINSRDDLVVTTVQDITPPTISNFKVDNTLVPGRADKIQTVVSWKTNEPATSIVYYDEGSGSSKKELLNKQEDLTSLTENHVIILTSLKPGTIYRFQVVSTDDANNVSKLPIRTIITPRQNESVMDVIFKNFDDTFKFMNNP